MSKPTLDVRIESLDIQIDQIKRKMAPLDKALDAALNKRKLLVEKRDAAALATRDPDAIDVGLVLEGDCPSMVRYEEQQRQLKKLRLGRGGYLTATGQTNIIIALTCGDSSLTDQVENSLKLLLPSMKPLQLDDDRKTTAKYISIMDRDLSERGSLFLAVVSDSDVRLMITAWHRTSEKHRFHSLREALDYIQNRHCYQEK